MQLIFHPKEMKLRYASIVTCSLIFTVILLQLSYPTLMKGISEWQTVSQTSIYKIRAIKNISTSSSAQSTDHNTRFINITSASRKSVSDNSVTAFTFNYSSIANHNFNLITKGEKITNYNFEWVIPGEKLCQGLRIAESNHSTLIILILSVWNHANYRDAIRSTWASRKFADEEMANGESWDERYRHVFLFGLPKNSFEKDKALRLLQEENKLNDDIVVADFLDSYYNLTRKVISGMQWVATFCPEAKYVVKVDEDTFVHVPRMFARLQQPNWKSSIVGCVYRSSRVIRRGKFAVDEAAYPLNNYPRHAKGNIYWMPANVSRAILRVAPHVPYVNIEDAFVTGILAQMVNASYQGLSQSDYNPEPTQPPLCDFSTGGKMAAQHVTPDLARKIWSSLFNAAICEKNRT